MTSPIRRGISDGDASRLDHTLVERVRAGDEVAFETLFRTYFAPLASLAHTYVRSREIAEELVQDVLLRVWEGRATWEVHGTLRVYLYAAVRHRAINHLRKRRVADRVDRAAADAASDDGVGWGGAFAALAPPPDAALETTELEAAVERAIAELPERCRETFVLSRRHELGQAEIAAVMGTSIKTVQAQMYKARQVLRRRLAAWLEG